MKTLSFRLSAVFIVTLFIVCFVSTCSANPSYIVTDMGPFQTGASAAMAINNNGQAAGWFWSNATNDDIHGFRWQEDSDMQDLGTLGGYSYARAINNIGQVVGYSKLVVNNEWYQHAFLYGDSGPMQDLGGFPKGSNAWNKNQYDSYAYGINDLGQIVGSSDTAGWYDSVGGYMHSVHAFLSNGSGPMQDLGTLGGRNSHAHGINNNGQVVGSSGTSDGYGRAFLWQKGSGMQDLGTLGGLSSVAYSINNNGQVVGYSSPASGNYHAFIWQKGSGMQDLGTLPAGSTPYNSYNYKSSASGINNKGQVVGDSYSSVGGASHAFLYNSSGQMQDLNNLVAPSQWTILNATGINDFGQIASWGTPSYGQYHAVLLTPVGNSQAYQVKPDIPPIERLAKWDGTNWVPVMPGDLSTGNIHVLVHGWGPGLKTFAEHGGKIWNEKDPVTGEAVNSDRYWAYTFAAQNIRSVAPGDKVVLFDWLNMSATENISNPGASLANTDKAAGELISALKSASNFAGAYNGKLQFIGISHGARVATWATKELYKNDSVVVNQLTLGDSPEYGPEKWGGVNNLDKILPDIKIGRSSGSTFVDNYYSALGRNYIADNDIVNVKLNPNPDMFPWDKHGYPLSWYGSASIFTDNVAINWSPLLGDIYKTLGSEYEQDWKKDDGTFDWSREYILKEIDTGPTAFIEKQEKLDLATLLTQGSLTGIPNGMLLTENSPAFWHTGFTKNLNDTTIEFSYQFLNAGDGDQLGLWIDDELRFIITGSLVGTEIMMSDIDIFGLTNGEHILSVALHNYGDANASVQVFDFTMLSIPESSTLYLLCAAVVFSLIAMLLRQKPAC